MICAGVPCPVGVSGTAESLRTSKCLAKRSGADRNVSTFSGLFPFLSLSLSFSLSLIVGFLPNTCICPDMMYKTKSYTKHTVDQWVREVCYLLSVKVYINLLSDVKPNRRQSIRNEVCHSLLQWRPVWGHCVRWSDVHRGVLCIWWIHFLALCCSEAVLCWVVNGRSV